MLYKSLAVLLVLLIPIFAESRRKLYNGPTGLHHGAKVKNWKDYRFAAAVLDKKGNLLCNAVLITNLHLLTASHCIYPYSENPSEKTNLVIGFTNYHAEQDKFKIKEVYIAATWNDTKNPQNYDLAVLLLNKRAYYDKGWIIGIPLPKDPPPEEGLVKVVGWGTSSARFLKDPSLKEMSVKIYKKGSRSYKLPFEVQGYHILTESPTNDAKDKVSCVGDNGGFLVYKNAVIGVSTISVPCTNNENLGVFTSVYHNLNSISRIYQDTFCLPIYDMKNVECTL
ncbi:kallikrein-6-like [Prorops nasuta]|uniref:kallikrein-6-like n=1 Tax=Prorops nasuta TaxID=863751 RepID=UPI0034CDA9E5